MAKTIKKSQLHESIRRYIKERLNREEEEMQADVEVDDMPPAPMDPKQEFKQGIDDLKKINEDELGGNEKLNDALVKLEQQFDNLYSDDDGGKEIGM